LAYSLWVLVVVAFGAWLLKVPSLVIVPFVLSLVKTIWAMTGQKAPRKIAHIGYSEAVMSTLFAVLVVAAFWQFP
jgi:hypothetical protein